MKDFKVSKRTDPQQLAGAIKDTLKSETFCELTAIGPDAITIVVKSLAQLKKVFKVDYSTTISYKNFYKEEKQLVGFSFIVKREN